MGSKTDVIDGEMNFIWSGTSKDAFHVRAVRVRRRTVRERNNR
jgi:hypothetical protein